MEIDSRREIEAAADGLLRQADALGRFPTPVDDIVAAASLTEPRESLLGDGMLSRAPRYLRQAMERLGGRVIGLVDRREREVHLDPGIAVEGRRRFVKLHETGHHILDWQRATAYADDHLTLSPAVRELYELEASRCAAELLFQRDRFRQDASDLQIGMAAVVDLHARYGASLRSTFWRYAEGHRDAVMGVVLGAEPASRDPLRFKRHELVRSAAFSAQFGDTVWPGILHVSAYDFLIVAAAATATPQRMVAGSTTALDVNGQVRSVRSEALCTGFNVLTLLWLPRGERLRKKLRLAG